MMQKLELYIHIPFCVQKCAYCDFLSAPANDAAKAEYVDALKKMKYKDTARLLHLTRYLLFLWAEELRPFCRVSRWVRFLKC